MATTIQLKRDTSSNWSNNDPTLASGEVGLETDTRFFKIGDGSTVWSNLPYSGRLDSDGNLIMGGNTIKNLLAILNSAQSSPPDTPSNGDFYMDDGTNISDGNACLRQYSNGSWEDVATVAELFSGDHGDLTNVTADAHHADPTAGTGIVDEGTNQFGLATVEDVAQSSVFDLNESNVTLPSGDSLPIFRATLPTGEQIKIITALIYPTGTTDLNIQVYNNTDSVEIYSTNTQDYGSYSSPLASGGTGDEIIIRLQNNTSSDYDVNATVKVVIE